MRERCAVLDWAQSGAMALTGMPDGAPVASPAAALALLGDVTDGHSKRRTRRSTVLGTSSDSLTAPIDTYRGDALGFGNPDAPALSLSAGPARPDSADGAA